MPPTPPTAAPPNFYENLPGGGETAGGGPQGGPAGKQGGAPDADDELMKGLTGVYRVLSKMAKLKKEFKGGIDKIKEDIKVLVAQGLKKDPKDLESGEDKASTAAEPPPATLPAAPPPGATPPPTDETHSA
jgi:hypothetical protein